MARCRHGRSRRGIAGFADAPAASHSRGFAMTPPSCSCRSAGGAGLLCSGPALLGLALAQAQIQSESGWQPLPSPWRRPLAWLLLLPIRAYRRWLTRWLPPACRFHPSCSHYAVLALAQHRAFVAMGLIGWRLLRCQPLCRGGVDWPRTGPYAATAPSSLPHWPAPSETDRP